MARMTAKKALAARKSWQERAETWRDKIGVSNLITALEKHARGEIEMKPTQVKAAQVLLDRVMPTLSASEITKRNETVSPEELIARMRERYGDQVADMLTKDYMPDDKDSTVHEPGHA